jgi:hypothetical protein
MPKVSVQGKTFDRFRTVNGSVRPFIGDLRLQERVSFDDYPDRTGLVGQLLWIVKLAERYDKLGACWRKVR